MHSFVKCLFRDVSTNFYWNRFIFDRHRAKDRLAQTAQFLLRHGVYINWQSIQHANLNMLKEWMKVMKLKTRIAITKISQWSVILQACCGWSLRQAIEYSNRAVGLAFSSRLSAELLKLNLNYFISRLIDLPVRSFDRLTAASPGEREGAAASNKRARPAPVISYKELKVWLRGFTFCSTGTLPTCEITCTTEWTCSGSGINNVNTKQSTLLLNIDLVFSLSL